MGRKEVDPRKNKPPPPSRGEGREITKMKEEKEQENQLRRKLAVFVETLGLAQLRFLDQLIAKNLSDFSKLNERNFQSPAQSSNLRPANEMDDTLDYYHGRN